MCSVRLHKYKFKRLIMKDFFRIKTIIAVAILSLSATSMAFAGGILTNTNPSARFARLMALDASTNADAAYYNPEEQLNYPKASTSHLAIRVFFKRELSPLLLLQ